jgi:hypothetical protein
VLALNHIEPFSINILFPLLLEQQNLQAAPQKFSPPNIHLRK